MGAAAWLVILCGVTLAMVALPLLARIVICIAVATPGIAAIRRVFLLRGRLGVRALAWSDRNQGFRVLLGAADNTCPAQLSGGSFRLGSLYLVLRLKTCDRFVTVFIDGNRQEIHAFRGLCRRLRWPPHDP